MLTFRLPFHRGRVEWVTCHVPIMNSVGGAELTPDLAWTFGSLMEIDDMFFFERELGL